MPAPKLIIDLIVETAVQNPDVPFDSIITDMLYSGLTWGGEARSAAIHQDGHGQYKIRNLDTSNAILASGVEVPGSITVWEEEKDNLLQLIEKAKIKRAKELASIETQPVKFKLYTRLLEEFHLPISQAINLVHSLSPGQVKTLKKITAEQMDVLNSVISQTMLYSTPKDCKSLADATRHFTYTEAIAEVERLLKGEAPTILLWNAKYVDLDSTRKLIVEFKDSVAFMKAHNITTDHLGFISPRFSDALITEYKDQMDSLARQESDRDFIINAPEFAPLNKAKDEAIQDLVDAGYTCPEVEQSITKITYIESDVRFGDDKALTDYINEKIIKLNHYVAEKLYEKPETVTAELKTKGEIELKSKMNMRNLHRLFADRSIGTVGLQENSASSRYSSPFGYALQMLKSVINYVNTAEIQNVLTNAAITYVATYSISSFANSHTGFFVGNQDHAAANLLESANNKLVIVYKRN
jgi:hypothetical protein